MILAKILSRFDYHIDFMSEKRVRIATIISAVLILGSFLSLGLRGLNFGIDFTGGTLLEVGYTETVELDEVRQTLTAGGYEGAVVQYFGTSKDVMIRLAPSEQEPEKGASEKLSNEILALLKEGGHQVEMRRVEFVGPQVGRELVENGGLAILYTMIGILIYVAFRFEYRFALGAILAALHDPIVILGVFSLTGMEFDLTVLAAILAVIGYSLNDTIVVFDRIRDNFLKLRKAPPREVMNTSINQTLTRTLMTSITTLLALLSLLFIGGEMIAGFAFALTVGIVVGTYSSIYVASTSALWLGVSKADLMPTPKEGSQADDRP